MTRQPYVSRPPSDAGHVRGVRPGGRPVTDAHQPLQPVPRGPADDRQPGSRHYRRCSELRKSGDGALVVVPDVTPDSRAALVDRPPRRRVIALGYVHDGHVPQSALSGQATAGGPTERSSCSRTCRSDRRPPTGVWQAPRPRGNHVGDTSFTAPRLPARVSPCRGVGRSGAAVSKAGKRAQAVR